MEPVVIYGAGGLGAVAQDILEQAGPYQPVAFLDSDRGKHGREYGGLPIWGGLEVAGELPNRGIKGVIVAIGDNATRVGLAETLRAAGLQLVSAIHPLATISRSAEIGEHVMIGPRATICVHARIGPHSVLSAGTIADHDNDIGRGVFLHPAVRLAGTVKVEDFAWIGIGASVIPGRRVGRGARVQAGSVVIRDVAPDTTVGGVPATVLNGPGPRLSRWSTPDQAV